MQIKNSKVFNREPKNGIHSGYICGMEKKKTLNEVMQDFADSIKKETQEDLKVKLELFLKEKYDITLTDDEWQHVLHD